MFECTTLLNQVISLVFSSEMSFPLNGYRMGTQAADNTKTNGAVRSDEDWPNWSDTEEAEKDKTQSVQISIRSAGVPGQSNSADNEDESEEPWDDFETSTKSKVLSPTESSAGSSRQSKALKLNSSVKSVPDHNHTSSWDTSWNQASDTLKPSKTSLALEPNPKSTIKSSKAGCLGEEFTIAVKKKPEPDPETRLLCRHGPRYKAVFLISSAPCGELGQRTHHGTHNIRPINRYTEPHYQVCCC